jgi:hypothetical protein
MRAGPEIELLTLGGAPAAYPQFRWQHPRLLASMPCQQFHSSLAAENFQHRKSQCKRLLLFAENYSSGIYLSTACCVVVCSKSTTERLVPEGARLLPPTVVQSSKPKHQQGGPNVHSTGVKPATSWRSSSSKGRTCFCCSGVNSGCFVRRASSSSRLTVSKGFDRLLWRAKAQIFAV